MQMYLKVIFVAAFTISTLLAAAVGLVAQPSETVRVLLSDTLSKRSKYILRENIVYRWQVTGTANIGSFSIWQGVYADARFLRAPLQQVATPRLPLSDNPPRLADQCNEFPSWCSVFFATNALNSDADTSLIVPFVGANAQQLLPFRFIPLRDEFNDQATYQKLVLGSERHAQFLFVDRFGEQQNIFYSDNFTGGKPSEFQVTIQRVSPELIVHNDSKTIVSDRLTDTAAFAYRAEDTISFGQVPVNTMRYIRRHIVNRGEESLFISEIVIVDPVGARNVFPIVRGDGLSLADGVTLAQGDTLTLSFGFQPQVLGPQTMDVRIYATDPGLTRDNFGPNIGGRYYNFVLRGNGTGAEIEYTPEVDFGNIRVGDIALDTVSFTNIGEIIADFAAFTNIEPPFDIRSFANPNSSVAPFTLAIGGTGRIIVRFAPTAIGEFDDTLWISGVNTGAFPVRVRGKGMFRAATAFLDSLRPTADTLDFGAHSPGNNRILPVFIRTSSNVDLALITASISTSPSGSINDPDEFSALVVTPFVLRGSETATPNLYSFNVRYSALPVSAQHPLGAKEAFLRLRIRDAADTSIVVSNHIFILRARKNTAALTGEVRNLMFDTVYVGSNAAKEWTISNNSAITIAHEQPRIAFGAGQFTPAPTSATVVPGETRTVGMRFQPLRPGPDSALVFLPYRTVQEPQVYDSLRLTARGFGALQDINIVGVILDPPYDNIPVSVQGDSIELGGIPLCGTLSFTVIIRNNGNLPFKLDTLRGQDILPLTTGATDYFNVIRRFPKDKILAAGAADSSLRFQFIPSVAGTHSIRYRLFSGIRTLVANAPASAETIPIIISATALKSSLLADKPTVDFGSVVYLVGCDNAARDTIRITNTGGIAASVRALEVVPFGAFYPDNFQPFTLQPGQTRSIPLLYTPATEGVSSAEMLLLYDAPCSAQQDTFRVELLGRAILPSSAIVSFPPIVKAKPGSLISVPVLLNRQGFTQTVSAADRLSLTFSFDPELLELLTPPITAQTATEGGSVITKFPSNGVATIEVQAPSGAFRERDTLMVLNFRTYFGNRSSAELAFSGLTIGTETCPAVVGIDTLRNGIFALDSVCGLAVITTPGIAGGKFRLLPPVTNSTEQQISFTFETAFATHTRVELFSVTGEKMFDIVDDRLPAGVYNISYPTWKLPSGLYFIRMNAGIFTSTQKLLLHR